MPEPDIDADAPDLGPEPEAETIDVRAIRQLVRLMKRYDLTAIDFAEGTTQIRLRRQNPNLVGMASPGGYAPAPVPITPPPASLPHPTPQAPPPPTVAPAAPAGVAIESPMVGTFYTAPSPGAPPYVSVGALVRADTTVCNIEAMKVFTDIPAGVAGTIAEVLVKDGQVVEFGQPLFRVVPG